MTTTPNVPNTRPGPYRRALKDVTIGACHVDDLVHELLQVIGEQEIGFALKATEVIRVVVADLQREMVDLQRDQGVTWADIGKSLYITRQAAQQRFGDV